MENNPVIYFFLYWWPLVPIGLTLIGIQKIRRGLYAPRSGYFLLYISGVITHTSFLFLLPLDYYAAIIQAVTTVVYLAAVLEGWRAHCIRRLK